VRPGRFLFAGIFLVLLFLAGPLRAEGPLRLDGALAQGGLVVGKTASGARVVLDGRPVRTTDDGLFLLGFGRDAAPEAVLEIAFADGTGLRRALAIAARDWPVTRIDGLPPRKVTPKPDDLARINADAALIRAARARDGAVPWFRDGLDWPTGGRISGVFGSRRVLNGEARAPHSGVDIAAPPGTPVAAAAPGLVVVAAPDMFFTGKTVMIDHGHGLATVYAHMSAIAVTVGETVTRGQRIGAVGASGRASGPHLHWGLSLFRIRLDPALAAGPMPRARLGRETTRLSCRRGASRRASAAPE